MSALLLFPDDIYSSNSAVPHRYTMPLAPKPPTAIRAARTFARREYGPSPLQLRFTCERSLPSCDTPLQTAFDLTISIAPLPPSITESATNPQCPQIRKPPGEVTRIKRGGYSLEKTLNWPKDTYAQFMVGDPSLQPICFTDSTPRKLYALLLNHFLCYFYLIRRHLI